VVSPKNPDIRLCGERLSRTDHKNLGFSRKAAKPNEEYSGI